jgi:signal transduction histidine kinase
VATAHRGLGIRPIDVGITAGVIAAVELNVAVAIGGGQAPLDTLAYVFGAAVAVPVLARRRWPFQVLIACSLMLLIFYSVHRSNVSPVPLLAVPLYDAAVAGYLAWAIVIPTIYMAIGLVLVQVSLHQGYISLVSDFLPSVALLVLAIALGETVRSRRALTAETASRLRLAEEERGAEAGRRVAEERLRIARELHDTVAHAMATITVQAGSALHRISTNGSAEPGVADALLAIRQTSKTALTDMRETLGSLRGGVGDVDSAETRTAGLDRLHSLAAAVRAAGAPVAVLIEGQQSQLPPSVDHAAYRILQESLTNVLLHAGQEASVTVRLRYAPDALTIEVADDGLGLPGTRAVADGEPGPGPGSGPDGEPGPGPRSGADGRQAPASDVFSGGGHGLIGMTERATAIGGHLSAGPRPGGGFEVIAELPVTASSP